MNIRRKVISLLVMICIILTFLPITTHAADEIASGTCGENLTWTLDSEGTLTISGSGPMMDYFYKYDRPWYSQCSEIKSVIIREGITSIGAWAFYECNELTNVNIPDSVTEIGAGAFSFCSRLVSVIIPSNVTSIENNVFSYCSGLTSVKFPESITTIGYSAFAFCSGLTDMIIPDEVVSIEHVAFAYSGLTNVKLPNCLMMIGDNAFENCGLTSIDIPIGVVSIGNNIVSNCSGLETISVDVNNPAYISHDGVLFTKDMKTLCAYPGGKKGEYTIPNGVTLIEKQAFAGCYSLTGVIIPESVTLIGEDAFVDCGNLSNVTIPDSVTSIGESAFSNCGFTNIMIPSNVVSIGNSAFSCFKLESIDVNKNNSAYTSQDGVLFTKDMKMLHTFPRRKRGSYTIPNNVISIEKYAFNGPVNGSGLSSISSITIPNSVISIDIGAFGNCDLKDVYYCGTQEQWKAISIGLYNDDLLNAALHIIPSETTSIENYSYSFANRYSSFDYDTSYRIPLSSYERIFGKNTKAQAIYAAHSRSVWSGSCAGMAATSALLAQDDSGIKPDIFNPSAEKTGNLTPKDVSTALDMDVKEFIEAMHIAQYTQLFKSDRTANRVMTVDILAGRNNLNRLHDNVKDQTDAGKPVVFALAQGGLGHAILGYQTVDVGNESQILVYDNNYPMEERYIILKKDESGNYTSWNYDMGGGYGIWGSDNTSSNISFVSYDTIQEIWNTRGKLAENENLIMVNSQDFSIHSVTGEFVATVKDGRIVDFSGDVSLMEDELSLQENQEDTLIIRLPVAAYNLENKNQEVEELEITVVDTDLGLTVTTTAQEVVLAVDDSCNSNAVYVDAGSEDTFSVTLKSSQSGGYNEIFASGSGVGDMAGISMVEGSLSITDCDISALVIDGEDQGPFVITAKAGNGGTISPEGETRVLKDDEQAYTITPDIGYTVKDVKIDGKSIGAVFSYTFSSVKEDHRIAVEFQKQNQRTGDVNGDGEADAGDLTALARHVAKIETITDEELLKNADVNQDGNIDSADLTKLARYVAKIISSLD